MSSNVSAVTKYFPTVNEGFITTLGDTIVAGANTMLFASVDGLTDGSVFVGLIEPGVENKEQAFTGTVDSVGGQLVDVVWTKGTNTGHAGGVTIVDYVTGTAFNMISAGMLKEHNQDGSHGALTVTSLSSSGNLSIGGTASITGNTTVTGSLTANGGVKARVATTASSATLTPASDATDLFVVTALAAAATIAAPTGTPTNGQGLMIRIKDNGTARALTWNAIYRAIGVTLPTTTVVSKELYVGMRYNAQAVKWDVLAVGRES